MTNYRGGGAVRYAITRPAYKTVMHFGARVVFRCGAHPGECTSLKHYDQNLRLRGLITGRSAPLQALSSKLKGVAQWRTIDELG
jgi:hypothetical protein